MIQFRCWHCHRVYRVADTRTGERLNCGGCTRTICVPKQNGDNSRVRTLGDWLIEMVLCGGGGAFLGACLAVVIISRFRFLIVNGPDSNAGTYLLGGLTLLGFLAGTFGGVRGIDWIGRMIRDRENS